MGYSKGLYFVWVAEDRQPRTASVHSSKWRDALKDVTVSQDVIPTHAPHGSSEPSSLNLRLQRLGRSLNIKSQGGPVRFGLVTIRAWDGSSGSGFRLRRFLCVTPCAAKTCAVRPVFARMVGKLGAADPKICLKAMKANARPGAYSQAPG